MKLVSHLPMIHFNNIPPPVPMYHLWSVPVMFS